MVLSLGILYLVVATAVACIIIRITRSKRCFLNDRRSQTIPKSNVVQVRLVIDGCNGPIRIHLEEKTDGLHFKLLFAFHGDQRKSVDLLPKLQALCSSAVVVFDGCSKRWPFDVSERSFEWHMPRSCSRPHSRPMGSVSVIVTRLKDEADNVIVRMDKDAMEKGTIMMQHLMTNNKNVAKLPILKLVRSEQGPGRQKSFLRPLRLLQSNSVACLFPHDDWSPVLNHQAQQIRNQLNQPLYKSLIRMEEEWIYAPSVSIVVTDDVYLRQRVQHCMSFLQLHDFLVDEMRNEHRKHI